MSRRRLMPYKPHKARRLRTLDPDGLPEDGFNALPDELLLMILAHFEVETLRTTVSEVCTRWQSLAMDASLHRRVVLRSREDWLFLKKLKVNRFISSMKICPLPDDEDDEFDPFVPERGRDYVAVNLVIKDVFSISYPNLTSLHIHQYNLLYEYIIAAISMYCKNIKHLDIRPLSIESKRFIKAIRFVESVVLYHPKLRIVYPVLRGCDNLKQLRLHKDHFVDPFEYFQSFHTLVRVKCDQLAKMTLYYAEQATFTEIAKCINLQQLDCRLSSIPNFNLMPLAALRQLTILHLSNLSCVTKVNFDRFIKALGMVQMVELHLTDAPFCDRNAKCLASKKTSLQSLHLIVSAARLFQKNNFRLTPTGVLCFAIHFNHLRTVKLSMRLVDSFVKELLDKSTIQEIEYFDSNYKILIIYKIKSDDNQTRTPYRAKVPPGSLSMVVN